MNLEGINCTQTSLIGTWREIINCTHASLRLEAINCTHTSLRLGGN